MKKQRYNISDLLLQIREKNIEDLNDIEFAILEVNGSLTIFTKKDNKYKYPFPLISDGKIDKEVINKLNIDERYINKELRNNKIANIDDVFLCFLGINDHLVFFMKENSNFNNKENN